MSKKAQPDHTSIINTAESAIKHAQDVRSFHRKRTKIGDVQRTTDIQHAEARVREAMKPIRSAIGHIPYDPQNETALARHGELRAMSRRIQTERRKLWKLRGGKRIGRPPTRRTK